MNLRSSASTRGFRSTLRWNHSKFVITFRSTMLAVGFIVCFLKHAHSGFVQVPHNTEVVVGHSTHLNCSSHEYENVEWLRHVNGTSGEVQAIDLKDGRVYVDSSRQNHFDLVFTNVTLEDAGRYICRDLTHSENAGAELIVLETLPICYSNVTREGIIGPNSCGLTQEPLKLSCAVAYRGNKRPSLEWAETAANTENLTDSCSRPQSMTSCNVSLTKTLPNVSHINRSTLVCRTKSSPTNQFQCTTDLNVVYSVGDYFTYEKTVGDTITCSVNTSSNQCSYKWNWTVDKNIKVELHGPALTATTTGLHTCEATCNLKGQSCGVIAMRVLVTEASFMSSPIFYVTCALVAVLLVAVVVIVAVCTRRRKSRAYESTRTFIKDVHSDTYDTIEDLRNPESVQFLGSDFVAETLRLRQDPVSDSSDFNDPCNTSLEHQRQQDNAKIPTAINTITRKLPQFDSPQTTSTRLEDNVPKMVEFPTANDQIHTTQPGTKRESDGIYLTFSDGPVNTASKQTKPPVSPKSFGVVSQAALPADVDRQTNIVRGSRKQISWCFFDQTETAGVDEQIGDALEMLSYKPSTALVFCSSLLLEDDVSVKCRSKPEGISFVRFLESKLPPPCTIAGLSGFGVIGTDFHDQKISEMERSLTASCLFFPKIDGFDIYPFGFDIEPREADDPNDSLVERVSGIPPGKTVKFIMVFLDTDPQTPHDKDLVCKMLGHYSDAVMAGGYTYGSLFNKTDNNEFGSCRNPPGLGVAFCGKDIKVASIILQTDVEKEKDIEARLLRLKSTNIPEWPSIAFMFSCMCRGTTKYRGRRNVESEIFRRIFPRTPLAGFFGRGEIGFDYLPFYTEGKANRTQNSGRRISGDIYHTFTTIFVVISFPQMNFE